MNETASHIRHPLLSRVRRAVYWILPFAILGFIFYKADAAVLIDTVRGASPLLYGLGILFFPLSLFFSATRWKVLLGQYLGVEERIVFAFKQYCIGLSVGIFLPGSIGLDVYRVAMAGRRYQHYTRNIAVVLEEKLMSLAVCVGLVLGLAPWLNIQQDASMLGSITDIALSITAGGLLGLVALFLFAKLGVVRRMAGFVTRQLQAVFASWLRRLNIDPSRAATLPALNVLFAPMTRPASLASVALLSCLVFVALGIANQLFLNALSYELSFIDSLFVVAVLFVVVSLPISFAGFGVREGGYILVLGMFGIPAETALVVSVFALSGMLLNYAIGGLFIYLSRNEHPELVVTPVGGQSAQAGVGTEKNL